VSEIISWDKAIDKKVKSSDDKDLGKVQSITRDYIQSKEGTIGMNYYYIPKYYMVLSNVLLTMVLIHQSLRIHSTKDRIFRQLLT
jgi:hypothetical protein